jgi:hypothetical protein
MTALLGACHTGAPRIIANVTTHSDAKPETSADAQDCTSGETTSVN